jgi:hypothetical protein
MCCICPVTLNKPGLCYQETTNTFVHKIQDWMVQMPETGFLFPAFNDRNTDIHSLLYYSKNAEDLHPEITKDLLGCPDPVSAGEQKQTFDTIIEETFSNHCDFEVAKTVHEQINALLEGKRTIPSRHLWTRTRSKNSWQTVVPILISWNSLKKPTPSKTEKTASSSHPILPPIAVLKSNPMM